MKLFVQNKLRGFSGHKEDAGDEDFEGEEGSEKDKGEDFRHASDTFRHVQTWSDMVLTEFISYGMLPTTLGEALNTT